MTDLIFICTSPRQGLSVRAQSMSNYDPDGVPESEWEDRGDLAWNEFDWERYLRDQDELINRYLAYYETFRDHPERIDEVAKSMEWDETQGESNTTAEVEPKQEQSTETPPDDFSADSEVYTLHKNPIFIATRALYLRVRRNWELLATDSQKVPQALALNYLISLHHGEDQAVQAIHALEFGDFAMAISLFKRALSALNQTLALLNEPVALRLRAVCAYRDEALTSLFDLREIWLRVTAECRAELERPVEDDES